MTAPRHSPADADALCDRIVDDCAGYSNGAQLAALIAVIAGVLRTAPAAGRDHGTQIAVEAIQRAVDGRFEDNA